MGISVVFHCNFPASSTWSQPETQGRPPPARHGHIIVAVGSKLYIHGGMAGEKFHNDMYLLDTSKSELSCIPVIAQMIIQNENLCF